MYRLVTWLALEEGVPWTDEDKLAALAQEANVDVSSGHLGVSESNEIGIDDEQVKRQVYSDLVEEGVSVVAQHPKVRATLVRQQIAMAAKGSMVMAGRDIGTVVLPNANLKVFLRASPQVRARRRAKDLKERGQKVGYKQVLSSITQRDSLDSQRATSPLRPAQDAIILDTNNLDLNQVARQILDMVQRS